MKRVFNIKKLLLFIFIVLIICASSVVGVYFCLIGSPSNKSEQKIIYVAEGNSYSSIAGLLKENGLIKIGIISNDHNAVYKATNNDAPNTLE